MKAKMLCYNLEERGEQPIYEFLYEKIRQDIVSGKIKAEEKLPSKRTLAKEFGIGLITVATAYGQLEAEGYIRAEEKRGFFVEDVSDYRTVEKKLTKNTVFQERKEFYLDFKANNTSFKLFPASIWGRCIREALSSSDALLHPVPYNGLLELRICLCEYLNRTHGMSVNPEQIIIGAGTEYLYGRLLQLFGPETVFALENPGYKKFSNLSESFGHKWIPVGMDKSGLDVVELEKSCAHVVHLCPNGHFPTGITMPIKRRMELFWWASRKSERYIIEDDYDSEFRYWGKKMLPLFASDVQKKVIYMNTFSKTVVPTLRISYMILPEKLSLRYSDTQSFYSCNASGIEQYALYKFIKEGHFERHIKKMRTYYRHQRQKIIDAIKKSPLNNLCEIEEHNAGTHFVLWVKTSFDSGIIRKRALEEGMLLSFLEDYSFDSKETRIEQNKKGCALVINYAAVDESKILGMIKKLCKILEI